MLSVENSLKILLRIAHFSKLPKHLNFFSSQFSQGVSSEKFSRTSSVLHLGINSEIILGITSETPLTISQLIQLKTLSVIPLEIRSNFFSGTAKLRIFFLINFIEFFIGNFIEKFLRQLLQMFLIPFYSYIIFFENFVGHFMSKLRVICFRKMFSNSFGIFFGYSGID